MAAMRQGVAGVIKRERRERERKKRGKFVVVV